MLNIVDVTADADTQEITLRQHAPKGKMNEPIREIIVSAGMVPEIMAKLMSASVALGWGIDFPLKGEPMKMQ